MICLQAEATAPTLRSDKPGRETMPTLTPAIRSQTEAEGKMINLARQRKVRPRASVVRACSPSTRRQAPPRAEIRPIRGVARLAAERAGCPRRPQSGEPRWRECGALPLRTNSDRVDASRGVTALGRIQSSAEVIVASERSGSCVAAEAVTRRAPSAGRKSDRADRGKRKLDIGALRRRGSDRLPTSPNALSRVSCCRPAAGRWDRRPSVRRSLS